MNEQICNRIRQCPSLPSLPSIAMEVLDLAQREEVDIAEIARVISRDPALSSKILRTVNSSFYGRSQSVSTISHALVILGLQSVKTLVLGFSLVTNLAKSKSKGFKHLNYWKRSIYAATAARSIASKIVPIQQEECFLAALMGDIGMLVLDQVLGDQYGAVCESAQAHADLVQAELLTLGVTHADAAGILAAHWKLPPLLCIPMGMHHRFTEVTDPALRKLTEIVYLAGRCADVFVDENAAPAIADVRMMWTNTFQRPVAEADQMLEEIGHRTKEVAPLFEINIGSAASFEAILKKANEALVDLTLRSQQQATTLQEQNQELKKQAATDALTGLANRACFDQVLAEQFTIASRAGRPMSLLMIDLDKFKKINDTHGHPAGDAILQYVGKLLRTAARSQDLAARYGGEEMVLILPGTAKPTAAAIAETICRAIASKPVKWGKISVPVTASVGVASYEPGCIFQDATHLIKGADMALYAAKSAGRNCVKVISSRPVAA